MRKKLPLAVALSLSLVCVGFVRQSKPVQYEYKVEYFGTISEKKLNELGADGWELISTQTDIKNGNSNVTSFYFKRPKQ